MTSSRGHDPLRDGPAFAKSRRMLRDLLEKDRCERLMQNPEAIFVFGSNLLGIHGSGAAREARQKYGAVPKIGVGIAGRTYAIPTCSKPGKPLPLPEIRGHVHRFLAFARGAPRTICVVTRVGCGLAGYTETDIKPFFSQAPGNCELPPGWRPTEIDWEP